MKWRKYYQKERKISVLNGVNEKLSGMKENYYRKLEKGSRKVMTLFKKKKCKKDRDKKKYIWKKKSVIRIKTAQ